jgi:HD-GYP domain-containing protein (c-di-GMP phosphodiesterase class II)
MPEIRTTPRPTDLPGSAMAAGVRLIEPLAALSRMSDLARGRPEDEAMRACLLAAALGREIGLTGSDLSDTFYTALLRFVGCTATSHEYAATFGGDDVAVRRTGDLVDATPRDGIAWLLSLSANRSPWMRAASLVRTLPRARATIREGARADCEVGAMMAARLSLNTGVQRGLAHMFERWDGLGLPSGLHADAIALPARVAAVAYVAVLVDDAAGPSAASEFVGGWAGHALDPAIARAFKAHAPDLLAEATPEDPWAAVVEREPGQPIRVPEDGLDEVAAAFGDAADLKSPILTGHSGAVAQLAAGGSAVAGMDRGRTRDLRRAGHLHDLGRAGVATGIWENAGRPTRSDWEQIRLHPYQTERILALAPALAPIARIAGLHHERTDGRGYFRGIGPSELDLAPRILAAADAYQAMVSDRPPTVGRSPHGRRRRSSRGCRWGGMRSQPFSRRPDSHGRRVAARSRRVSRTGRSRCCDCWRTVARSRRFRPRSWCRPRPRIPTSSTSTARPASRRAPARRCSRCSTGWFRPRPESETSPVQSMAAMPRPAETPDMAPRHGATARSIR